ncbi:MAG: undecaprenyl-diphosphatase UppP [Myxococcales bacterium]|nr:undecaprenyl-diphosphatase UppP [Myxococcales bacterium]
MPVYQAIVLGVVQGLGEFLPISSSAHLILVPWAFGWQDPGLSFDVALHWGTLTAVLVVFWRDWIRLISAGLSGKGADTDRRLFWGLVVSAIPGAILGKLLEKWAEENLRAPLLIAATMATLGIILWIADRVGRKTRELDQMTIGRAFSIGVAQAAALIPGVSRSGSTITLGLFEDFTREEIARFSFLMSTPIIFGAGLLKLPKMMHEMQSGEGPVTWAALAAGFVAAAVVGVGVIRWMLAWLRTRTYLIFVGYRLLIAAAVVVLWLAGKR